MVEDIQLITLQVIWIASVRSDWEHLYQLIEFVLSQASDNSYVQQSHFIVGYKNRRSGE